VIQAGPLQLLVLISGRGSNMAAIAAACDRGEIAGQICGVIADRLQAPGLQSAQQLGIATQCIAARQYASREQFDAALLAAIERSQAQIVVLAGFMRILGSGLVDQLRGRLLNIHPSLLPRHPGLHTHQRALAEGDAQHGATVHFVTPELDGGPAVLQGSLAMHPDDTETTLSARVQTIEHIIYPRVLGWIAAGRLQCPDGQPQLDGRALTAPIVEHFNV
jgi:phosphoribosylglycinamide formyltransferase-1